MNILDIEMDENDAGANTVRDYLKALLATLLATLWEEGEGFSGKRPFGNSGWEYDLYKALVKAGVVDGKLDEDGYVDSVDKKAAYRIIQQVIQELS